MSRLRLSPGPPGDHPLRVVQVVTSRGFGGIERHVLLLAAGLRRRGVDCSIACPPAADRLRTAAATAGVPLLPGRAGPDRLWLVRLAATLVRTRPTIVHVHDGIGALALSPLATCFRVTLVRTQHFAQPASAVRPGLLGRLSRAAQRRANARAAVCVAVSAGVAEESHRRGEVAADRLVVIPPGIVFPPDDAVAAAIRSRLALAQPVVCFVGRLERDKRVDLLVEAIPHLRERVPECRVVVAGDGSAAGAVRARAAALGVDNAVEWLGWVDDPAAVLARAHVFANPCAVEGFGLAPLEAMAWGLPVVAVRSSGALSMLEDEVTGLVVSAEPRALGEGIARLAGDPALARRLGDEARAVAMSRFSIDTVLERVEELYRAL